MSINLISTYSRHKKIHTVRHRNKSLTLGFTVPEGDWSFILGHETSSTGKAEDPAWFWLVGAQRAELARTEPVSRVMTCWTLTWEEDRRKSPVFTLIFSVILFLHLDVELFVSQRHCLTKLLYELHNVRVSVKHHSDLRSELSNWIKLTILWLWFPFSLH